MRLLFQITMMGIFLLKETMTMLPLYPSMALPSQSLAIFMAPVRTMPMNVVK